MARLVADFPGVALLCRLYRDRVLCVHQDGALGERRSTYERGLAMPLFRGAASRVILAQLPGPAVTRLRARHAVEFAEAGLGATPAAVRSALLAIRRRGWDRTEGQVTPGVTGIAAPVQDATGGVVASLSLTLWRPQIDDAEAQTIAGRIIAVARDLGGIRA